MRASLDSSLRARRGDLLVRHPVVPGRHLLDDLADDPDRLPDLVESYRVAVEVVTVGPDDHVEIDLVVVQIRHRPAEVPRDPCGPPNGPGEAEGQRLFGRQPPDR